MDCVLMLYVNTFQLTKHIAKSSPLIHVHIYEYELREREFNVDTPQPPVSHHHSPISIEYFPNAYEYVMYTYIHCSDIRIYEGSSHVLSFHSILEFHLGSLAKNRQTITVSDMSFSFHSLFAQVYCYTEIHTFMQQTAAFFDIFNPCHGEIHEFNLYLNQILSFSSVFPLFCRLSVCRRSE